MDEFLALAHAKEYHTPVVIARLFNTVGPRQTGQYGMVLPRFIQAAKRGQPLRVYGMAARRAVLRRAGYRGGASATAELFGGPGEIFQCRLDGGSQHPPIGRNGHHATPIALQLN
jgi:hypothetical protein